ncbi:MAG: DNA polymerase I, partial [Chloroflexota bacterium]|nr:DNA polymerase I [Chloroflexota bacterium]
MSDKEKKLLVLFDGHALIHRAFHALPPFATKSGEATGAVSGFANMILKVLGDLKPTHCAVAFDHPAPTFRHKEYAEYKAHRPPAPEELKSQFGRVRQLVDAFNIASFELEGYEADDLLGTLARQATEQGIDTIIVTGDMDTLQLVSPHVRVLTPRPGRPFSDTVLYDNDKVNERYGLSPEQVADFKGLKGDPSDNIPGVPGVGEKTATKLLQQFESVDGIYEHIVEVEPVKLRTKLTESEAEARRSKMLATIVTDAPVSLDPAACARSALDRPKALELFRELELNKLLGKLDYIAPPVREEAIQAATSAEDYRVVDTDVALDELISMLSGAPSFAIDLETNSLDPLYANIVGLSFCIEGGKAFYIPVGHRVGTQLPFDKVSERLKPILADTAVAKIAHNGKYDSTVLAGHGIDMQNLSFDTMLAAYLLSEKSLGLKALAFNRLGIEMTPITQLIGTGAKQTSMDYVAIPDAARYACCDADMTWRLAGIFEKELKEQGLWKLFSDVEMPLVPILREMERTGVSINIESLYAMSQTLGARTAEIEAEVHDLAGQQFNLNSPQQLGMVLFDKMGLPGGKKTKGGFSTDASVLEGLKGVHPAVELVLEYRQLSKLKSTYVDALPAMVNPVTGRIHTSFNQTGTTTGRLSSSNPNLQNIPVRGELGMQVRKTFVAGEGYVLLSGDYSQIDLRVLAHLSQDPQLLDAFRRGDDIHRTTASQVFDVSLDDVTLDMRRLAKTVNFGVIYGMSGYGLEQATDLSRAEASQFIKTYFDKYGGVKEYLESTKQQARERGYVETMIGRRRYIPDINSSNGQVRASAERMAINMPIQGTAADITKLAMILVQRAMDDRGLGAGGRGCRMLLQVHDELVFEVPPEALDDMRRLVIEVMPNALKLDVPLTADVKSGDNWGEMR